MHLPKINHNLQALFWKIAAWAAIAILVFILSQAHSVYSGAQDGSEALKQSKNHQIRIDSMCRSSDQFQLRLSRLEVEFINSQRTNTEQYDKLIKRIDDVYQVLISK